MKRLVITADIHGNYPAWRRITDKCGTEDLLVVAGDLFGNRFPPYGDQDFRPADIRSEYQALPNEKYLVYGNCDLPEFFPGGHSLLTFSFEGLTVLLCHGDKPAPAGGAGIVISGHTHTSWIRNRGGKLYINPGSPSRPRDGRASYAIYAAGRAEILPV